MQKIFSYPIQIDNLSAGEKHFSLVADAEQCAWIADIFKVEKVHGFTAEVSLRSDMKKHIVNVSGKAAADIEQKSVISLENFVKNYATDFSVIFDTKATYSQIREEFEDINIEAPKVVENGEIDIAAVAMEEIALILDDYPRKEGEVFEFQSEFSDEDENAGKNNPFSVLKNIK